MILASQIDAHGIAASMGLRRDIRELICKYHPANILETGTYHGLGTTSAVLHALNECKVDFWSFITIESDKENFRQATKNLDWVQKNGSFVMINANSLPHELMPRRVYAVPEHVITDYADPTKYLEEVPKDVDDDGLDRAMKMLNYRPDMVILDSAGHIGFLEFEYVCKLSESSFLLILDDTLHRKHYDTMEFIRANPTDFQIIMESDEKFGHAVIHVK